MGEVGAEVRQEDKEEAASAPLGISPRRAREEGAPTAVLSVCGNGLEAEVGETRVGEEDFPAEVRGEGIAEAAVEIGPMGAGE